jgi:hypothetical protein
LYVLVQLNVVAKIKIFSFDRNYKAELKLEEIKVLLQRKYYLLITDFEKFSLVIKGHWINCEKYLSIGLRRFSIQRSLLKN